MGFFDQENLRRINAPMAGHKEADNTGNGGIRSYLGAKNLDCHNTAAIGVLAAPANTATKPIADKVACPIPPNLHTKTRLSAPIKNGVHDPPLPPKPG